MTTSGFLYRDILKYILPTLFILGLFTPLLNQTPDLKSIIAFGIVISLVVGPLLGFISKKVIRFYPGIKSLYKVLDFCEMHWDSDKIFYYQTKENRDYLYLTAAYGEFYRTSAFIIFIYIFYLLYQWLTDTLPSDEFLDILEHKSSIIGGIKVYTVIIIFICTITLFSLVNAMIFEYEILSLPNGQYDFFAEQVQKEQQSVIAKFIYGTISNSSGELVGNEITLYSNGVKLDSCMSIERGYWHMPMKESYINRKLELSFTINQVKYSEKIRISYKERPYFALSI